MCNTKFRLLNVREVLVTQSQGRRAGRPEGAGTQSTLIGVLTMPSNMLDSMPTWLPSDSPTDRVVAASHASAAPNLWGGRVGGEVAALRGALFAECQCGSWPAVAFLAEQRAPLHLLPGTRRTHMCHSGSGRRCRAASGLGLCAAEEQHASPAGGCDVLVAGRGSILHS